MAERAKVLHQYSTETPTTLQMIMGLFGGIGNARKYKQGTLYGPGEFILDANNDVWKVIVSHTASSNTPAEPQCKKLASLADIASDGGKLSPDAFGQVRSLIDQELYHGDKAAYGQILNIAQADGMFGRVYKIKNSRFEIRSGADRMKPYDLREIEVFDHRTEIGNDVFSINGLMRKLYVYYDYKIFKKSDNTEVTFSGIPLVIEHGVTTWREKYTVPENSNREIGTTHVIKRPTALRLDVQGNMYPNRVQYRPFIVMFSEDNVFNQYYIVVDGIYVMYGISDAYNHI